MLPHSALTLTMQEGTQALPDPDIYDKAIGLLQWTTQEIAVASASQAQQHDGFSLPSSFGSFHSDSLDAALRELESMQRSTSTERLHRCFIPQCCMQSCLCHEHICDEDHEAPGWRACSTCRCTEVHFRVA